MPGPSPPGRFLMIFSNEIFNGLSRCFPECRCGDTHSSSVLPPAAQPSHGWPLARSVPGSRFHSALPRSPPPVGADSESQRSIARRRQMWGAATRARPTLAPPSPSRSSRPVERRTPPGSPRQNRAPAATQWQRRPSAPADRPDSDFVAGSTRQSTPSRPLRSLPLSQMMARLYHDQALGPIPPDLRKSAFRPTMLQRRGPLRPLLSQCGVPT